MIGNDSTIDPNIILKGLATTDPSLLVDELNQTKSVSNQTKQVANQSALIPSEISKNQSASAYQQAEADKTNLYITGAPAMMGASSDAYQTFWNKAHGKTVAPPPPVAPVSAVPAAPLSPLITPNTSPEADSQPIADNTQPDSINTDNEYSTGLDS